MCFYERYLSVIRIKRCSVCNFIDIISFQHNVRYDNNAAEPLALEIRTSCIHSPVLASVHQSHKCAQFNCSAAQCSGYLRFGDAEGHSFRVVVRHDLLLSATDTRKTDRLMDGSRGAAINTTSSKRTVQLQ